MAKYRVLVQAVLLKNNTLANYGDVLDAEFFVDAEKEAEGKYIELVKEKPVKSDAPKAASKATPEAVDIANAMK